MRLFICDIICGGYFGRSLGARRRTSGRQAEASGPHVSRRICHPNRIRCSGAHDDTLLVIQNIVELLTDDAALQEKTEEDGILNCNNELG